MMINKRLLNLVPKSKKYVFITVALKLVSLISNFVLVFSVASIIGRRGNNVSSLALMIALSVIVTFSCNQLISIASFYSSKEVKKTLRTMIYEKLLRLGPEYQEKTETAKIIQWTVEGVEQIEIWFGQYLPQFFYSMIAAVLTFLVLSFIHLKMALILLACVPLIPISIVAVQKIAKKLLGRYMAQYANLADNYLENLQGLTTLKIYDADEERQKKLGLDAENFRRITMKVLSFQLNSIIVMDTVAYGGAGLGIMTALSSYLSGQLSLEHALVCILLSADFFIPLRRLGSYFHTAMNGTTASNNIFALLDTEENKRGGESISLVTSTDSVSKACFEVKNLSYSFGERTVVDDISLTIPFGSFTAFVGKSGSGKSTTAKVLAGINVNYQGNVYAMGKELSTVAPESLYKFCTYISHKDWIFKGTVRDCLLEGNPSATDAEMWKVLGQVQLAEFIRQNGGLELKIQEDASNLSGGQKQRLSIARALLHNSEVYVFDEATSNIDVESEMTILELLHMLKSTKTIIMISHRKENCKDADQIYEFENGTIQCRHTEQDPSSMGVQ